MKQDLPQLVDERRFRRREQDTVERDEFGRVRMNMAVYINIPTTDKVSSANGPKKRYPSPSSLFPASISAPRLWATVVLT